MPALLRSRPTLAVLALVLLHMAVFDRGLGGDGWAGFALLESLAEDGDVWLEDDHRGIVNGLVPGQDGHLVSQYPPGILLLDAVPFFLGRTLGRALGGEGGEIALPPVGPVPRKVFLSAAAIVLARNAATLLGLAWIAMALLRLGYGERTAAAAAALTFFGGPMVFYSLVGMTHAPTFALASLLLLLLVRQRESGSWKLALAAGAVVGLGVLVRYSVVALLPAAALAATGKRSRPALLAGFGLPLAVLPFWWRASFGAWGAPPYGGDWSFSLASPWNVLFHPVHGLFLFHPALLLAAAGLAVCRLPGWKMIGAVWFLGVAFLHGGWSEWANTGGYGQRFLIDALPVLGLGFAETLAWRRNWKTALAGMVLFGYLLFFAAVGRLAAPPPPLPWPQTLDDYAPLLREPPGPARLRDGLREASFLLRALT